MDRIFLINGNRYVITEKQYMKVVGSLSTGEICQFFISPIREFREVARYLYERKKDENFQDNVS